MNKKKSSFAFFTLVLFSSLIPSILPATPLSNTDKQDQLKSIVQEVLHEHGFSIKKESVVLIEDGQKITVAMDISRNIAENLASKILDRLKQRDAIFREADLEMNLFGAAEALPVSRPSVTTVDIKWDDVLSRIDKGGLENGLSPSVLNEFLLFSLGRPVPIESGGIGDRVVGSLSFEKARAVILSHLESIQKAGAMKNTILLEDYWKAIFSKAGSLDLFTVGRPLISEALLAGIRPYQEGKNLDASTFASLAINAIRVPATIGMNLGSRLGAP